LDAPELLAIVASKKPIVLPETFRAPKMMIVQQDIMQHHQLLLSSSELYQHQPEGFQRNQYKQRQGDDLADAITKMMWEQFGIRPTEHIHMYQQPYPEWFDRFSLPHRYKVPEFFKFSGQDNMSTVEHIS
jgi:hypothetical protein